MIWFSSLPSFGLLLTILGSVLALWFLYVIISLCIILYFHSDVSTALTPKAPSNAWDVNQKGIIWITGAGSGLGELLAYHIAENSPTSAKLILSSRNEAQLQRVAKECKQRASKEAATKNNNNKSTSSSLEVAILPLDLSDLDSIPDVVEKATKIFGNKNEMINTLINAAGVTTRCYVQDSNFDLDQYVCIVNYLGPICLLKQLMKLNTSQNNKPPSTIIQLGSIAGKLGAPVRSAYSGSKFAFHGWLEALGVESVLKGQEQIYILNAILGSINTGLGNRALINVIKNKDTNNKNTNTNKASYSIETMQQDDKNIGTGLDPDVVVERILAVAHAKQIFETWIAKPTELVPILYFVTYFRHTAFQIVTKFVGPKYAVTLQNKTKDSMAKKDN